MSAEPVIPGRWRDHYEYCLRAESTDTEYDAQRKYDEGKMLRELGTAEALIRDLAAALRELETRTRRVVDCAANGMAIKEIVDAATSRIPKELLK